MFWLAAPGDRSLTARASAVAEPVFVVVAGTLVARVLLAASGTRDPAGLLYRAPQPDFLGAALAQLVTHAVRYGIVILLAVLVGWMRGRRSAASYGVTTGSHGVGDLVVSGLLLAAAVSLPMLVLHLVNAYVPLGPGTPFWALEERVPWTLDFWIYTAVGSYLVVPLVEEVVARGYTLGRLRETFSPGSALIIMAVFFAFAHGQYHQLNALAVGELVTILFMATALGYSVYLTGSLLPAIIAHACLNVPMTLAVRWMAAVAALVIVVACRRRGCAWFAGLARTVREIDDRRATIAAMAAVLLLLFTLTATPWTPFFWLGASLVITLLSLRHRRRVVGENRGRSSLCTTRHS